MAGLGLVKPQHNDIRQVKVAVERDACAFRVNIKDDATNGCAPPGKYLGGLKNRIALIPTLELIAFGSRLRAKARRLIADHFQALIKIILVIGHSGVILNRS